MNLRPVKVENVTGLHIGLGVRKWQEGCVLGHELPDIGGCVLGHELPDIGDYTTIRRIHDGEERHTTAARSTADKCGLLHSDS